MFSDRISLLEEGRLEVVRGASGARISAFLAIYERYTAHIRICSAIEQVQVETLTPKYIARVDYLLEQATSYESSDVTYF